MNETPRQPRRAEAAVTATVRGALGFVAGLAVGLLLVGVGLLGFTLAASRGGVDSTANAELPWLAAYVLSVGAGGTLTGVLWPLGKRKLAASLIGFVACLPITTGYLLMDYGSPPWPIAATVAAVVASGVLGPAFALSLFGHLRA